MAYPGYGKNSMTEIFDLFKNFKNLIRFSIDAVFKGRKSDSGALYKI